MIGLADSGARAQIDFELPDLLLTNDRKEVVSGTPKVSWRICRRHLNILQESQRSCESKWHRLNEEKRGTDNLKINSPGFRLGYPPRFPTYWLACQKMKWFFAEHREQGSARGH